MQDDILKQAFECYEEEMAKRDNADYEVNREQMSKLKEAYGFFRKLAEENGGKIDPFRIAPKEVSGGVTVYFTVFYLSGEDMKRFCEISRSFSALSIDSLSDGTICISFTIPNVYQRRK